MMTRKYSAAMIRSVQSLDVWERCFNAFLCPLKADFYSLGWSSEGSRIWVFLLFLGTKDHLFKSSTLCEVQEHLNDSKTPQPQVGFQPVWESNGCMDQIRKHIISMFPSFDLWAPETHLKSLVLPVLILFHVWAFSIWHRVHGANRQSDFFHICQRIHSSSSSNRSYFFRMLLFFFCHLMAPWIS